MSALMSASTGGLSTRSCPGRSFSLPEGEQQPPSHTQQPLNVRGCSAGPQGAQASRGCSKKWRGTSPLTVHRHRCSQGALAWSQRHTPISSSHCGQALPAGNGPWRREGLRGSAAPGLEGLPAGWPWPGVPLKSLGPTAPHGGSLLAAAEQGRARLLFAPEVSLEMLSPVGGGPSPSSSLALGSLPRPCAPCPPALGDLRCSTLSHSWGPLLGHHQCQPLWAWMGRCSWNSLPWGAFLRETRSPFQIIPLAAGRWVFRF